MCGRGELAVLCVAVALRAAVPASAFLRVRDASIFHAPDTGSYIACAESLARGEGFARGGEPEIIRTPGYPLLLVPGVLAGRVAAVTIPLQVALGALTVWLVCRLTGTLTGSPRAGVLAGLFCACEPLSVLYCGILLSETLFAAVLLASLLFFSRFLTAGRIRDLMAAACGFSAAVYVRPLAYWLPLVMAAVLAASARRGAARGCAFVILCAVLVGAWQARNYRETGYRGFSAINDINMYFYHAAGVESARTGKSYYAMQGRMGLGDMGVYLDQHPRQRGLSPAQRYVLMGGEGRAIVRAHPGLLVRGYAAGMIRTAFDPGATEYLKLFGLYREGSGLLGEFVDRGFRRTLCALPGRAPRVFWGSLVLGGVLGGYLACAALALRARGLPPAATAAVAASAVYLLLLSGGLTGNGRFRHPVMPLLCVFAGCGLDAALRRAGRGGARYFTAGERGMPAE